MRIDAVLAGLALALSFGCSRRLELHDPGDGGVSVIRGPEPPAQIPEVADAGVLADGAVACADRPTGQCLGTNDFPCDFPRWVSAAADACLAEVDCRSLGWLGVRLDDDGCVSSIEMTDPDAEFVACLAGEFRSYGCTQCDATHSTRFLGTTSRSSCSIRCTNDSDCPSDYYCQDDFCARDLR